MSITLEGTSVKYTISTPSVFTINESNIDKLVSAAYTPTVTRNKTGSAATRYIVFSLAYGSSEWNIACWKAVFAANSKTATVTAYNTPFGPARMGDVANDTFNKLGVGIDTSASLSSYFDFGFVSCGKKINLYPTITLTPAYTQSTPSQSTFGRIINICQAAVTAAIKKTWSYTGGTVTVPISESSVSGGGKSVTGTTQNSLTLNLGVMTATSITVTASAKNSQGLTASATITLTCDDYTPPDITSETAIRDSGTEENAVLTVNYLLHAKNQAGTTGAIKVFYEIKDGNTVAASGSATICASGSALGSLSGSIAINITGQLLDVDTNYSVSMYIQDRISTGTAKKDIITSTFRLLHIDSGGKGIGIGGAAPARGLKVYDDIEADSFNGIAAVFGTYLYNSTSTDTITFTDANCQGKNYIICGGQRGMSGFAGPEPTFAELDSGTGEITVHLSGNVTVARINYICW